MKLSLGMLVDMHKLKLNAFVRACAYKVFLATCVRINLKGTSRGLQHPQGTPSVDPSTHGRKTLHELASFRYCYIAWLFNGMHTRCATLISLAPRTERLDLFYVWCWKSLEFGALFFLILFYFETALNHANFEVIKKTLVWRKIQAIYHVLCAETRAF